MAAAPQGGDFRALHSEARPIFKAGPGRRSGVYGEEHSADGSQRGACELQRNGLLRVQQHHLPPGFRHTGIQGGRVRKEQVL